MSPRSLIAIPLAVTCLAFVWAVLARGHQVSELRVEQRRLEAGNVTTSAPATGNATALSPTPEVPRELLQLRAEVARLSQQQRELASARPENERLRLELENRRTNSPAAKGAAGGYLRTSAAKWLGYSTPEDTLQSFLWAKRNHDLARYLEALLPDTASGIKEMLQNSTRTTEQLFGDKELPPVYRIAGRREHDGGYVELEIKIAPDIPGELFLFQQVGGQWKLQSPH